jgi:lysylphosphatidylglycerol synthetase-like protein (DUF2156 family)
MSPQVMHVVLTIAFVVFIAWRMQVRVRRLIGRQPLKRWRLALTLVFFPVIVALLALAPHAHPRENSYLGVGLGLGVVLGMLGLRLSRFEVTPEGKFYTPNAHIGVALSVLLVARLIYRFAFGGLTGTPPDPGMAGTRLTPLTMMLFGALAGYYCTYAAGLLWWSARAPPLTDTGPG